MPFERLLAGAALAVFVVSPALAQTGGSMTQPPAADQAGAMQPPQDGSMSSGANMTGGSMSGGGMAGFTPIQPIAGANIIAELKASGEFTMLLKALDTTNLTNLIATHPNLTLLAPTNAAFAALPSGQLDTLMKEPAQLQAILTYHLIATTIKESDVKGHAAGQVMTADKKQVTIDGSGATIKVNDAMVLQSAVPASNGEIYPIDKVLTPPAA